MSVALLLAVIVASMICIQVGAIALQLTGVEPSRAKFQALSAFTNAGYTTRESEEIINVPIRREIVSVLIILGHAGTVSVIAAFATSLVQTELSTSLTNLLVIIIGIWLLYRITKIRRIGVRLGNVIRQRLQSRYHFQAPTLEEMLKVSDGFGVMRVVVHDDFEMLNRSLQEMDLKPKKIQVLLVRRGDHDFPIPDGTQRLLAGDAITCYGDMTSIVRTFCTKKRQKMEDQEKSHDVSD